MLVATSRPIKSQSSMNCFNLYCIYLVTNLHHKRTAIPILWKVMRFWHLLWFWHLCSIRRPNIFSSLLIYSIWQDYHWVVSATSIVMTLDARRDNYLTTYFNLKGRRTHHLAWIHLTYFVKELKKTIRVSLCNLSLNHYFPMPRHVMFNRPFVRQNVVLIYVCWFDHLIKRFWLDLPGFFFWIKPMLPQESISHHT